MSLEGSLGNVAAFCVGTAAVAFGAPPAGAVEATVGAAGLIGFILGRARKFGPECHRVRGRIQAEIRKNYENLISGSDGSFDAQAELAAADDALKETLGQCIIDRKALAASAVSPAGFPDQAVLVVLKSLGEARPDLFGPEQRETLAYRLARDVIHAGIEAAVSDADYYRQLEPILMYEMAAALGSIRDSTARIELLLDKLSSDMFDLMDVRQSKKFMEEFIQNFFYELRSPVTNIIGFLELAEIDGISDEKREQYYSSAHSASTDVLMIINKALALAESDTTDARK